MELKVIVHEAEEGGYWAEVTFHTGLRHSGRNIYEAVVGCLSVGIDEVKV